MRRILVVLGLITALAFAQQKIDPSTQIQWPLVTGAGAPTLTCVAANYGQPYTDVVGNVAYFCGSAGWVSAGSGGSLNYQGTWSSSVTYKANAIVTSGGINYFSLIGGNLNNPPSTSPSLWQVLGLTPSAVASSFSFQDSTFTSTLNVSGNQIQLVSGPSNASFTHASGISLSAAASSNLTMSTDGSIGITTPNFTLQGSGAAGSYIFQASSSGSVTNLALSTTQPSGEHGTLGAGGNGSGTFLTDTVGSNVGSVTAAGGLASLGATNGGVTSSLNLGLNGDRWSSGQNIAIVALNGPGLTVSSSGVSFTNNNSGLGKFTVSTFLSGDTWSYALPRANGTVALMSQGTFTTTVATSEAVTLTGCTTASHAWVQATNSVAAALTGVFVDTLVTNGFTLHHSATSGGTFNTFCTAN